MIGNNNVEKLLMRDFDWFARLEMVLLCINPIIVIIIF